MKEKSKKKFARTENEKWRDRYHGKRVKYARYYYGPVPSWFRKMFNRERQAKAKRIFYKKLSGYEIEFEVEKKTVRWFYW